MPNRRETLGAFGTRKILSFPRIWGWNIVGNVTHQFFFWKHYENIIFLKIKAWETNISINLRILGNYISLIYCNDFMMYLCYWQSLLFTTKNIQLYNNETKYVYILEYLYMPYFIVLQVYKMSGPTSLQRHIYKTSLYKMITPITSCLCTLLAMPINWTDAS